MESELDDVVDLYEDDELVLMKTTYKAGEINIINTDVGIKDSNGEIVEIITAASKIVE